MWLRPMRLRRSARLRRNGLSRCAAQARAGGLSDVASGARLRLLGVVVYIYSDTAIAITLFRVKKANAATVTKEDLLDPNLTQIVGVCYKQT